MSRFGRFGELGLEEARTPSRTSARMRHSFASFGAEVGLSLPTLGRRLGHTQLVTTQRYAHLGDDPVRDATERIGARIQAVMG